MARGGNHYLFVKLIDISRIIRLYIIYLKIKFGMDITYKYK